MSGFLEGLVRRGAGLGAAPGEQTATLRPLSRFEQPASGGPEGDPALSEGESFVAAPPHVDRESIAAREEMPRPPAPIAPRRIDPAPAAGPMEAQDTFRPADVPAGQPPRIVDIGTLPPAASALPVASPQTIIEHTPAAATPNAVAAPAVPQVRATHDINAIEEVTRIVTATAPPQVVAPSDPSRPDSPQPIRQAEPAPRDAPEVAPRRAASVAPRSDLDPRAAAPPAPPRHESPEEPAPKTSITIGRIEIDFGPKPAAPAAAPRPQRTRGFAAYARARRGQSR